MKRYKEVIIEISKNCNLNCIMCGYGARFNKPNHFMDYGLYDGILKQIGGDFTVLRLNGRGESTIHPEFIKFINRARELYPDGRLRLFTNMNYKNDDITAALADCGCETMMSFDSVKRENLERIRLGTSYDTVLRNIDNLCNKSGLTAIVFTLQPDNFFELYSAAEFARGRGCHFFCNAVRNPDMDGEFLKLVNANVGLLKEEYIKINELYEGSGLGVHLPSQIAGRAIESGVGANASSTCADFSRCPNVGRDICIYYNGDVTPCGMFNPYVLGNIKERSLNQIMDGEPFKEFVNSQKTDPYCKNCEYMCD